MSVQSEITRIQNGVATQADLIEDIQDALETGSVSDTNAVHYTADAGKTDAEKAIARANIGAAKVNNWRLINNITLTEDVLSLELTKDDDEISYNYSEVLIFVNAQSTSGNPYCAGTSFNTGYGTPPYLICKSPFHVTDRRMYWQYFNVAGGVPVGIGSESKNSASNTCENFFSQILNTVSITRITKITFWINGSIPYPTGTTIKIYARD